MGVSNISATGINNISQSINFKSAMKNSEPEEVQEKSPKDALTSPMELVGRSQVNFKGAKFVSLKQLSSADLNFIAPCISSVEMSANDIPVFKEALVNVLNKNHFRNIKHATGKLSSDCSDVAMFVNEVGAEALKLDPNVDLNKIGLAASAIF